MSTKGRMKIQSAYSRMRQKEEFKTIMGITPNVQQPDWDNLSIAKAWREIDRICNENGIDYAGQVSGTGRLV